ncbi:MAG: hypothetical protein ACP5D2_04785 [Candidatus Nanoarchaeia archaeon]
MKKKLVGTIGLIFIISSVLSSLFNLTITGAVVGPYTRDYFSFIAIVLFLTGMVLIFMSKPNLVEITETDSGKQVLGLGLRKQLKRHRAAIESAAKKIGTGTGKEEKLRGYDLHSIRAGSGQRLLFTEGTNPNEVIAVAYLPDHGYGAWLKNNGKPYRNP